MTHFYPLDINFKDLTLIEEDEFRGHSNEHFCKAVFDLGDEKRLIAVFEQKVKDYYLEGNERNSWVQNGSIHRFGFCMQLDASDRGNSLLRAFYPNGYSEFFIRAEEGMEAKIEHYDGDELQVRMSDMSQERMEVRRLNSHENDSYPVDAPEVFARFTAFAQEAAEGMKAGQFIDLSQINEFTGMSFKAP